MDSDHHDHHQDQDQSTRRGEEVEQHPVALQQPLTIFYNGQVSTCSVDQFQARAILLVARREMEKAMMESSRLKQQPSPSPPNLLVPSSISPQLGRSLSMKRSLQQFLHKRNNRNTITTPSTPSTTTTTHHP